MTAYVGLTLFSVYLQGEAPMAENSLSVEVPLSARSAAAAVGCWPNYYHLKEQVHSSGISGRLYSMCVVMLSLIAPQERDCVSA